MMERTVIKRGFLSWTLWLVVSMTLICVLPAHAKNYRETKHGITVRTNQPEVSYIRLEVIDSTIVRVSAAAKRRFPQSSHSLMTVYEYPEKKIWNCRINEKGETVVATAKMQAVISPDGNVRFEDLNGHVILRERERRLTPFTDHQQGTTQEAIHFPEKQAYHLRQVWDSQVDEAYYGLGQHQSDEFNWKDRNELLIQYNTKVTIPFVQSSRHYGILWDNYSLSRWGDERDFAQLNQVFKLYDAEGREGGLSGTYTPKDTAHHKVIHRVEPFIFLENAQANEKYMPKAFPLNGSNVVYEGEIEAPESGEYSFRLYYAGYVRVCLNKEEVVPERWRTAWNPNAYKFSYHLEAGQRVPLRIEWKPDGGVSYCSLRALSPRPASEENTISFWSEMGDKIDYYFVYGKNADEVISGYRHLTGKAPIMPKWAMGYWQCREHYHSADELTGTLAELRRREIPCDVIIQDWNYWPQEAWGSHEFDTTRYPDPQAMVDEIHRQHAKVMISVWPKFYVGTEHFQEFDRQGWMYRQAVQDSLRDWIGQGYLGSFYDAYSSGARQLFWKQMDEHLNKYGFDAWWMDASEPNIRDCVEEDYCKALCGPTALGSSTEFLNAYGLMNAQAIYEGQRSADPNRRVLLLTRSGFAGVQRYSTSVWSGDIASRWEDMKAQIPAGINFSMSGVPFWSMDIGGFCVENRFVKAEKEFERTGRETSDLKEWRELQTRWYQFGAFIPFFRSHGQYPYREMWNIAPDVHPAYQSMCFYDDLRYRLLPYLYSLDAAVWFDDYTLMRGLAMDFGEDDKTLNVSDQYMFGPALMVCPVYQYETRLRKVYFPENQGGWYNLYDGSLHKDGVDGEVEAPYDRIPVFVPAGSIIPIGPSMQYSDEKPLDEVHLYVYAGKDGRFSLYEDEGCHYDYERGLYSFIHFKYEDDTRTLCISAREGSFPEMVEEKDIHIHLITPSSPLPICSMDHSVDVHYTGEELKVRL